MVTRQPNAGSKQPVRYAKAGEDTSPVNTIGDIFYLDRRAGCSRVLLKIIKVILRNGAQAIETYAILDDGSEKTILLEAVAKRLGLRGTPEELALRTVRQDIRVIHMVRLYRSPFPLPASHTADSRLKMRSLQKN